MLLKEILMYPNKQNLHTFFLQSWFHRPSFNVIFMLLNPLFIEIPSCNLKQTTSLYYLTAATGLFSVGDRAYLPAVYGQLLAHLQ